MLKYVDTLVSFSEVPDEISLCINISGCPNNCEGCHSSYLREDIGEYLDDEVIENLISDNTGITCVCLMGGDQSPAEISCIAGWIKTNWPNLKVAWYSGKLEPPRDDWFMLEDFDYIKLGPYIPEKGPLNNPSTNQRLFKIDHTRGDTTEDITYKFWNNA